MQPYNKMCQCGTISLLLILTVLCPVLNGQDDVSSTSSSPSTTVDPTEETTVPYDPKNAYCFEFTWLGPAYDSTMKFESNCEDFLSETNNNKNGLCRQPFVITNNSQVPDVEDLWKRNKIRVVRAQKNGEVCAKWSYRFNDEVMNITYMRTKVFVENEGPLESGCYKSMHGNYEAELCLCKAQPGDVMPCNAATAAVHLGPVGVNARLAQLAAAAFACMLLTRRLI